MRKDKIDVVIPAFKAHSTMMKCLSSVACQTIVDDVTVTIVNDCCPEGDYGAFVEMFLSCMDIKEIRTTKNGGPGAARQLGIDSTDGEFITFVDADDLLYKVDALEILRREVKLDEAYMCAWSSFIGVRASAEPKKFCRNPVWMFGKLYRKTFIEKYRIHFNETRANEDSGFNHIVMYLCDNAKEKIRYVEENLYRYCERSDSITRINKGQYYLDQCLLGVIENMIYAIEYARRYRPFSEMILDDIVGIMIHCYFYHAQVRHFMPPSTIRLWEYIKKFYHRCYKAVEDYISEEAFGMKYSEVCRYEYKRVEMCGVIPKTTIHEFMEKLRKEEYNPNLINEIEEEMAHDPAYQEIMRNNIACGVCAEKEEYKDDLQIPEVG